MTREINNLDELLDRTLSGIRNQSIDEATVDQAAARVWARLSDEAGVAASGTIRASAPEHIESCADFQSLMPAFVRNELSEARALLLQDHTHECIPCRRALKHARTTRVEAPRRAAVPAARKRYGLQPVVLRWGIAAVLVIGSGLLALPIIQRYLPFGNTLDATVMAAEGPVYKVSDNSSQVITPGTRLVRGDVIRTSKDGRMTLKLGDGSLVEVKDRSEFSFDKSGSDTTLKLDRGNVIVEAAKQKNGHLFVAANDALVSVTGTTFAVNSGTKGARVSVIDGEVRMDHAGNEQVIRAGEQATTNTSLETVPVAQEVAWSSNASKYNELLSQITGLRKELGNAPKPGVRYSTRLLDLMPEQTVLYAALPNLSQTLADSQRIMEERIRQNPALHDWWQKNRGGERQQAEANEVISKIREFGSLLGDEIAVGAEMDNAGNPAGPIVVATVKDPVALKSRLEGELKELAAKEKNGPSIQIIDDLFATAAPSDDARRQKIYVWISGDLLVASPRLQQLQGVAVAAQNQKPSAFTATTFHERVAVLYREGAGLLVAADLEKIVSSRMVLDTTEANKEKQAEAMKQLGVSDLKYFIVEQKEVDSKTLSRAVLGFNKASKGITTWLAAPGPMGSLDYISPDANIVAAFVVSEPVGLVDDLLGVMETVAPKLREQLTQLQAEHGVDIRSDVAGPLGGEFAFAIDGPILPTPAWKMVFEVNDPARMQQTFERVVDEVNKAAAKSGFTALAWDSGEIDGRKFYTLRSPQVGLEFNYAFVNGYMIAAPTRALVDRAIRYHDSGLTLKNSKRFASALPTDGNANFSAIFYHDLASLISPIADKVASSEVNGITPEQKQSLASLAADTPPTLAYAYAQGDRIVFAANTEGGGPFGLSPATLLGMPSAFDIQHILTSGLREKSK